MMHVRLRPDARFPVRFPIRGGAELALLKSGSSRNLQNAKMSPRIVPATPAMATAIRQTWPVYMSTSALLLQPIPPAEEVTRTRHTPVFTRILVSLGFSTEMKIKLPPRLFSLLSNVFSFYANHE